MSAPVDVPAEAAVTVPSTPPFVMPQTLQQYYQFPSFRNAVQSRGGMRRLMQAASLAHGVAPNTPPRRRVALLGGRCVLFVARDVTVGICLWIVIALLAFDFFFVVVPFANSEELRSIAMVTNSTSKFPIGPSTARFVLSVRPFVVNVCAILIVITQLLLAWLLVADPGFVKDDSDEGEELSRYPRMSDDNVEEMARARIEPMPPHWTEEERRLMLETARDQVLFERDWIQSVETDTHLCPVCCVKVRGFDHHCGVVGACIGRRTMPCFVLFLTSAAVMLFFAEWIAGPLFIINVVEGRYSKDGHFPPLDTLATAIFFVSALYLGLYTMALSTWYWLQAFHGEFSNARRRRKGLMADWVKGYEALDPARASSSSKSKKGCCRSLECASAWSMLAPLCKHGECELSSR